MPHDLVSAIKALRKEDSPTVYELEEAVLELGSRLERLEDQVHELRDQLKRRLR